MELKRAIGTSYGYECVMPEYEYDAMVELEAELRTELAKHKSQRHKAMSAMLDAQDENAQLRAEGIVLRDNCAEKISADLVVKNSRLETESAELRTELDRYKTLFHDVQLEAVGLRQDRAQALTDLARTKRECTDELDMFRSNLEDFRDDDQHMRRRIEGLEGELTDKQKILEQTAHIAFKDSTQYQRQIKQLASELAAIKPSWDDAPEWVHYLAMDKDGRWFWYKAKPSITNRANAASWVNQRGTALQSTAVFWRDTLEHRPD